MTVLLCIAITTIIVAAYLLYRKKETYNSGASQRRYVFVEIPTTTFVDDMDENITKFDYAK
jgi:hypothetical protein